MAPHAVQLIPQQVAAQTDLPGDEQLRNLVVIGHLDRAALDGEFLGRLVDNAKRLLQDARVEAVSLETRCIAAYTAAHLFSLAALHVRGYAPNRRRGHRALVFQTLAPALQAAPDLWVPLSRFHQLRNDAEYRGANNFLEADLRQLSDLAVTIWLLIQEWLRQHRPALVGSLNGKC